jgi:hypothetical protein
VQIPTRADTAMAGYNDAASDQLSLITIIDLE